MRRATYIISGLKKPLYSSCKAWGRSQWKRVTNGTRPVSKSPSIYITMIMNIT